MTQKELELAEPGSVLKVVVQHSLALSYDPPLQMLTMFVVKRGEIADWAIYAHTVSYLQAEWDTEYFTMVDAILLNGTKITQEQIIREISGCDDEMFKTYRY